MVTTRKRSDGIATSERLINEAAKEIQKFGVDGFDVQRVMTRAKATNGSLYHHFGSKTGLIAAAEIQELVRHLAADNRVFRNHVESCKTKKDLLQVIERLIEIVASTSRAGVRSWRLRAIALGMDKKAVAKIVKDAQVEETRYAAETLAIARDRGLISTDINLEAVSYWMQGQLFGFVLLENGELDPLRNEWKKASLAGMRAVLCI